MDNKNPIDQWLKHSFDQELPGDMAPLWDRINQSLEKKKKRFAYGWIFAAIIVGALIIIGVLATLSPSKTKDNYHEVVSDVSSKEHATKEAQEVPINPKTTEVITSIETAKKATNKKLDGTETEAKNAVKTNEEVYSNKVQEGSKFGKNNLSDGVSTNKKEVNSIVKSTAPYIWFSKPIKPTAINSGLVFNEDLSLSLFPTITLDLGAMYPTKDKYGPILPKNPWSIGLNLGLTPTKQFLSIAAKDMPYVHKNYLTLRKQGEKAVVTSQFEVYFRKNIGHLFLQTGYSFFKTGYTQNYNYQINEIAITSQLNGNQPDANGRYPLDDQTPYIMDPTPETVTYQGKRINSFSEIPLNIGYTFKLDKFVFTPTLGAGINFTKQIGGTTIDYQNLKLIDFNNLFQSVATTNYSWNVGFIAEYPITKNIYIQAQPFYRKFITGSTNVVQSNPMNYGLNLGLNLKLHNNE